ncbi:MAG: hypothetical protein OXN16_08265 [Gammaproteobacteria bacterium]|nr:hypothetical protein [Gammaproteobacteria bacterium]
MDKEAGAEKANDTGNKDNPQHVPHIETINSIGVWILIIGFWAWIAYIVTAAN